MKTLQQEYQLIKEGKGNKDHFLKVAKHMFPEYITSGNDFDSAIHILKSKSLLSEGIGGIITQSPTQPNWFKIFDSNIKEAVGVKNTREYGDQNEFEKIDKETEETLNHQFDNKDDKNIDNVYGQSFLMGYYTEMKDPKNKDKTVDELKAIVLKNMTKDINYYHKEASFGVKGIGYTSEAPGAGIPKEPKGKFKSSGYGDIDKKFLNENKIETIDSYIKSEKYGLRPETWVKAQDLKKAKTNESLDESKPFAVIKKGGAIGRDRSNYLPQFNGEIIKTFDTAEEAKQYASERRKRLTPGEKSYYGMTYIVVKTPKAKTNDPSSLFKQAGERSGFDMRGINENYMISKSGSKKNHVFSQYITDVKHQNNNETLDESRSSKSDIIRGFIKTYADYDESGLFDIEAETNDIYKFSSLRKNDFINKVKFGYPKAKETDIADLYDSIKEEIQMNESKRPNLASEIKEIEKSNEALALEAKMKSIDEAIEKRKAKLSLAESEELAELVDPSIVKILNKEIKELEKYKTKITKIYEKMTGTSKKEVIDENSLNEGYGMSLEDAKAEAKKISREEGVVQHVEETSEDSGEYRVSDWYDSDLTVASYENGMEL